jgi:hypothetical protein
MLIPDRDVDYSFIYLVQAGAWAKPRNPAWCVVLKGSFTSYESDILVGLESVMLKYQYAVLCLVELLVKGRIAHFSTLSLICSFHGLGAMALFGSELVLNLGILWIFDTTVYRISGSIVRFVPT